ncbi:MAG: YbaY family lipoprotein [Pseudomonas sp.]|nr:YbaY family lipoprotein [Pseudomonas sp.]
MSLRPLALLCLFALLGACSSAPPVSTPSPAPLPTITAAPIAPLPAELRELSGQLLGVPLAGEAEVALLLVDQRDRPLLLLASTRLSGNGGALPFSLRFAPNQLAPGMRAELRARVSQGGVLTLHLPPRQINPSVSVALGELRLVPAP